MNGPKQFERKFFEIYPQLEQADIRNREMYFQNALAECLGLITKAEKGWESMDKEGFLLDVEDISIELEEQFPVSLGVQAGINAIVYFDQMVADHLTQTKSPRLKNGQSRERLIRLTQWQQYVGNFLIAHLGHFARMKHEDSVHNNVYECLLGRVKINTQKILQDVFALKSSGAELVRECEKTWRGAMGPVGVAHTLIGTTFKAQWASPKHDLDYSIDLFARRKEQKDFAIQVKTVKDGMEISVVDARNWSNYPSFLMADLQLLDAGVKKYNSEEGNDAIPVYIVIPVKPSIIDERSGYMTEQERHKLLEIFETIEK